MTIPMPDELYNETTMSFKEFNSEGPGTFGWDYVIGGNTTGLFPEETYYEVDDDKVTKVTLAHTGGGKYEPVYGESWNITASEKDAK